MSLEQSPKPQLLDKYGNPIKQDSPKPVEDLRLPVIDERSPIVDRHENPIPADKNPAEKAPINKTQTPETDPYKGKTKEQIAREFNERIKNISFVDIGTLAENEAIDAGDSAMTEKKGEAGLWKRFWNHNIMRDYFRRKEIIKAEQAIKKSDNIYTAEGLEKEAHDKAMDAIMDRFNSEYKEAIRGDERKKKLENSVDGVPGLKASVQDVIKRYAKGELSEETFKEERNRILSQVTGVSRDVIDNGSMYADEMKKVAEQVKLAMSHGVALEDLDLNFDITVGRARSGVRTEAQYNKVDKLIKSINSSKWGARLGNETSVALAIAGATSALTWGAERASQTTGKLMGGLIGGTLVSGAIIGLKENMRQKMERRQHLRDMAKGKSFEEGSVRREDFERTRYETKAAGDMTNKLLSEVYVDGDPKKGIKKFATKAEFDTALATITEIEGRLELSSKEQIDLIAYSDVKNVEIENTRLQIEQARAKTLIKKEMEANPALKQFVGTSTFDETLNSAVTTYEKSLLEGDLAKKDMEFRVLKRKAIEKAVVKGMLVGAGVGIAFQELLAFANPRVDGAVERLVNGGSSVHAGRTTMLEGIREWWSGNSGVDPAEIARQQVLNPSKIPGSPDDFIGIPKTAQMIDNGDGTINILNNGKIVGNHIPLSLNPDGSPSPIMEDALAKAGLLKAGVDHHAIMTKTSTSYTPEDFVEKFKDRMTEIKRDLWYDNDTKAPVFDKNELHTWWGGENNTGITADGKYVLNMSTMSGGGSYHEGFSTDAQELMKNGGVKLLLSMSRGTQDHVFEVTFDKSGNAIIDPNSEIGKLFFETVNGHAVFKGQFAEVAQMMGTDSNGTEHVRLLSTVVGHGIDAVKGDKVVPFDYDLHKYVFDIDRGTDIPPIIPIIGRNPLESTVKKDKTGPNDKPPVGPMGPLGEIPPTERVPGEPKAPETFSYVERTITEKEYMAMQDDLKLINLKMQNHKGVLELEKSELKSDYAKARYDELNFIRDGIPTQWNLEELKWLGDELEFILSSGKKIDRDPNEFLGKLRTNYELKQSYQSYVFELQNKGLKDVRGRARIIQSMHMVLAQVDYLKTKRRGTQTSTTFLKSSKEGGIGNMNVKSPQEYMATYLSQLEDNIAKVESKYGTKSNWEEEYENALAEVHQVAIAKGKSFDEAEFEKAYKKGEVFAVRAKDGTILKTGIEGKKKEKVNVNGAQKIAEAKALLVEANKAFDEIIRNKDFTKKDPAFDWLVRIPTGKKVGGGLEKEGDSEDSESLLTDEVWEKFKNEGRIPIEVIYDLAEKKYVYNKVLNEREQAVYGAINDAWGNTTADKFNADLNKKIGENKTADTFITKELWDKIFAGEKVSQDIIEKIAEKRKNKTPLSNHELFVFVLEIKKITELLKKEKKSKAPDAKKKPDSSKKKPDDAKKGPDVKKKKSPKGLEEFNIGLDRKKVQELVEKGELYTRELAEAQNIIDYPELVGEYEYYKTTDPKIGNGKIEVYKFQKIENEDPEITEEYDEDGNLIDPDEIIDDGEENEEENLSVALETADSEPEKVDIKELLTYKRFSSEDVQKLIGVKKLYEKDTSSEQLDEIKSDYERFENLLSHKENPMDEIDQFKSEYVKILIIEQQQNFGSLSDEKQAEQVLDQMSKLIKKFS